MYNNDNDIFVFRKYMLDDKTEDTDNCLHAAIDKLQTLYPDKRVIVYDNLTIGIETDSLYSDSGIDTYELGMVDDEINAIRNTRDGNVITFRM